MNPLFNAVDWECLSVNGAGLGLSRDNASTTRAAFILEKLLSTPVALIISGIGSVSFRRAHIRDPRVRKLADGITEGQVREIGEIKKLIADLEANSPPDRAPPLLAVSAEAHDPRLRL
jgi:hypothetical protein